MAESANFNIIGMQKRLVDLSNNTTLDYDKILTDKFQDNKSFDIITIDDLIKQLKNPN